jgi:hypothetical protein
MNKYNKDETEILDIPIAPTIGNNTLTFDSAVSEPAGLGFSVSVSASGKTATCLVSSGTYPNTYACKVYFSLTNGAKRAARFQVTMLEP